MKHCLHLFSAISLACSSLLPAQVIWNETFEDTELNDRSGSNQNLQGSSLSTLNTASARVVSARNFPRVASNFTRASGKFIQVSVGDSNFAALASTVNPYRFPRVSNRHRVVFRADIFIPRARLDVPVGRFQPRLEVFEAEGNGLIMTGNEFDTWGEHTIEYTGTVSEFRNLSVSGRVTSARPFFFVEQKIDASDDGTTENFLYVDNISMEILPPELPEGLEANPVKFDQDNDGLPDIWQAVYDAQGIRPGADSDNDGLTNLEESQLGTDPFDPNSRVTLDLDRIPGGDFRASWNRIPQIQTVLESSADMGLRNPWGLYGGQPSFNSTEFFKTISRNSIENNFFRLRSIPTDTDGDFVPDWLETRLGSNFRVGQRASISRPQRYDLDGDGDFDTTLPGDLAAVYDLYRTFPSPNSQRLTRAQASRFLLQASFGAGTVEEIDTVAALGREAWIDQQMALPPTLTRPYIDQIKDDFDNGQPDASLSGYLINDAGGFVGGSNYMTAWMRSALLGEDKLRQRVGFALSQILVASRGGTGLANQSRATAEYYDHMLRGAFGNYEDLLMTVSLSPYMGLYLSHLGNQEADPSIGRFPDENYAREIMQLFSIGLVELNMDGTPRLDSNGNLIETYNTEDITNVARVFTGLNYNSSNFGGGFRDDGDSSGQFMVTPMRVFGSHHDFGAKRIPAGIRNDGSRRFLNLPARTRSRANAMRDIRATVRQLVRHPNCAPFISRQLIQFLVTANPTPEYVRRVAEVFADNGSGVTGDLEAVVKAIYLDQEAQNPLENLKTPFFGGLREPIIRQVHYAKVLKLDRHDNLLWWDFGTHREQSLQEPMHSPTVFNFYRPDFRLFGSLSENELDSPVFGIVDSYSAISFQNWLWRFSEDGFRHPNGDRFYNGQVFRPDYSELIALADDIPALLDHLSLLLCAGTLGAESRATITEVLESEPSNRNRARLAAYLVLFSPEGSCVR